MNMDDINPLRPKCFDEFIGQKNIVKSLLVYINAAKIRDTSLDHTLFIGHPGLGKTTLAYLIAREMDKNIIILNANSIDKPKDIIVALSKISAGDIIFIDEIHALNSNVEEVLYSAMEDFYINLNVKNNAKKEILKFDLPPFTLIGASTKPEDISKPLLDRFSINIRLEKYNRKDITTILYNASNKLNFNYNIDALNILSDVSRFTPRIALNLLKRVNDYALIKNIKEIDRKFVISVLKILKINKLGLNAIDIKYLKMLHVDYEDKPVGINTISSYLNETNKSIQDNIENYLIELAFIKKTSKGRIITEKGIKYLNSVN